MQRTMDDNDRKRNLQIKYNEIHNITPFALKKSKESILKQTAVIGKSYNEAAEPESKLTVNENDIKYLTEGKRNVKKLMSYEESHGQSCQRSRFYGSCSTSRC